jgi:uncharacterized protein (TIGR00251 family)
VRLRLIDFFLFPFLFQEENKEICEMVWEKEHGVNIRSCIKDRTGNVELCIYCQPRASKTEIVGLHGDALKVRLAAPPVEGQANTELCQFFGDFFGVSRQDVQILSGKGARQKRVLIKGKTAQDIQDRLPLSWNEKL